MNGACGSCRFWKQHSAQALSEVGECRRYPPVRMPGEYAPSFPMTAESMEQCGEYQWKPLEMPPPMTRERRLEILVEQAGKVCPLGPFVPGEGPGSTVEAYQIQIRKSGLGNQWVATIAEAPVNPRGIKSVTATGSTQEEAAKHAYVELWLGDAAR